MLKVGLTGGIGSGKSTVAEIFDYFGIPVYNSDQRAKYLMENDSSLKKSILDNFSDEAYKSGRLNRLYLSKEVFSNKEKLEKLNNLVHPVVAKDFEEWCIQQNAPFVIKEAAILIESGAYKGLDKIIVVIASENTRIDRVVERDKVSVSEVRYRMDNQLTDKERLEFSDFVIDNDGVEMLIPQVEKIYRELKAL